MEKPLISRPPEVRPRALARLGGFLYLIIIVCGVGSEALVRSSLVVAGDPATTAENLLANELPFRVSILADVAMVLSDVALAVVLYVLLRPVDRTLSLAALALRLVQAAILGLNLLNLHAAIGLLDSSFSAETRAALVLHFLQSHAAGYDFGLFFFGAQCLVMSVLLVRSGFFPSWLGYLLGCAGVVYLAGSTLRVVAPEGVDAVQIAYAVPFVAELAFCVWLIVKGLDAERWAQRNALA